MKIKTANQMNNKILAYIVIILLTFISCKKNSINSLDSYIVGEIVNFDLNCSTCILKFPDDALAIKHEIGASRDNFYQTLNLMKDTFKINQRVLVKLRKAQENEFRACITLYPTYDYLPIYVIDFKSIND